MIRLFAAGLVIGAVVTAPLAYNLGRDAPLLSNPFEERTLGTIIKKKAKGIADDVKDGVKEISR
jgi:hypothetical protein